MNAFLKENNKPTTTTTSLELYLSNIGDSNLLTKDEEVELAKKVDLARFRDEQGKKSITKLWRDDISSKDLREAQKARDKLIASNLRLVASIAKKFQNKGCDFEDILQEGNIGLIDGIDRFDYKRGLKVSTYCTWWIRQKIDRLISNHSENVRLPVHVGTWTSKLKKIYNNYIEEFGCHPSIDELSELLGCTAKMAKAALQELTKGNNVSIDQSVVQNTTGEEIKPLSFIKDEDTLDPLDILSCEELVKSVREVIDTLSPRDEKILRLRFGISENPEDYKNWPITKEEFSILLERKKTNEK